MSDRLADMPSRDESVSHVSGLNKQKLGRIIARRRKELGLTQNGLARKLHIESAQTISRWERGERVPMDLASVATGLGITLPGLLHELDPLNNGELDVGAIADALPPLVKAVEQISANIAEIFEGLATTGTRVDSVVDEIAAIRRALDATRDDAVSTSLRVDDDERRLDEGEDRQRRTAAQSAETALASSAAVAAARSAAAAVAASPQASRPKRRSSQAKSSGKGRAA